MVLLGLEICHTGLAQLLDAKCHDAVDPISGTPWIASIYHNDEFICHGTLIHKLFVVTATSCIGKRTSLIVRFGEYDKSCTPSNCDTVEQYGVSRGIKKLGFDSKTRANDLFLLRLFGEVEYNAHIRPICIIFDDVVSSATIQRFKAFGLRPPSKELQTIHLFQKVFTECQRNGMILQSNQTCAGPIFRDNCQGYNGGPLTADYIYGGETLSVLFGIVSHGRLLGTPASIYTDVTAFKDWIFNNVRNSEYKAIRVFNEECRTNWTYDVHVRLWEVSLNQNTFAGALVTNQLVVTVATAFLREPYLIQVNTKFQQYLDVVSVHRHPQFAYSSESIQNNIALLKLSEKIW
ncbi:trypsin alpha isoform X2 [Drosophila biarmipes]|uniref:trypsin alpha isoform X2 n=1 Tax=Drosophila biarmipes TaxID=125945 RepID=UPI0021CCE95E|nr:trypsin alpha isoform X2 [Drosophila biarmipes]